MKSRFVLSPEALKTSPQSGITSQVRAVRKSPIEWSQRSGNGSYFGAQSGSGSPTQGPHRQQCALLSCLFLLNRLSPRDEASAGCRHPPRTPRGGEDPAETAVVNEWRFCDSDPFANARNMGHPREAIPRDIGMHSAGSASVIIGGFW